MKKPAPESKPAVPLKADVLLHYLLRELLFSVCALTAFLLLARVAIPLLVDDRSDIGLAGAWTVWLALSALAIWLPFTVYKDFKKFLRRYQAALDE